MTVTTVAMGVIVMMMMMPVIAKNIDATKHFAPI
jgi:hypothetical protein